MTKIILLLVLLVSGRSLLEVTSTEVNFDDEELHEANSCDLVI